MNVLLRKLRSAFIRARRLIVSQRFGVDPAKIYGQSFYEDGGFSRTEHSAQVIAGWIMAKLEPKSVLDLGSGAGYYLREFERLGVEALGLEASPAGVASSGSHVLAIAFDLRRRVYLSKTFDVVMCIEVAEHMPKRSSDVLVDSICANSGKFVVFSAAPPGTPGADHINCQSGEFWFALFRSRGFTLDADLTEDLRRAAVLADTAEWWKSWAWCFRRERALGDGLKADSVADSHRR